LLIDNDRGPEKAPIREDGLNAKSSATVSVIASGIA
jgi:hypothetical protein